MGVEDGHSIQNETKQYNDILQYDFIESHYNLTIKAKGGHAVRGSPAKSAVLTTENR